MRRVPTRQREPRLVRAQRVASRAPGRRMRPRVGKTFRLTHQGLVRHGFNQKCLFVCVEEDASSAGVFRLLNAAGNPRGQRWIFAWASVRRPGVASGRTRAQVLLRVTPAELVELDAFAALLGRPRSAAVVAAVREVVRNLEERQRADAGREATLLADLDEVPF